MNQENTTRLTLALNQAKLFETKCEDEQYTDGGDAWNVLQCLMAAAELALGNDSEPVPSYGIEVNLPKRRSDGELHDNWVRIGTSEGELYTFKSEQAAEAALRLCYDVDNRFHRVTEL